MIKAVTITNHLDESIRMELARPELSGFNITRIEGLGPVKADINLTQLATTDGSIDNSARLTNRNIVMSLLFLEHPTIEATRLLSYKYFPIKRNVIFEIETDSRHCKTVGRIETNEPDIFSKGEGCQISILCPKPFFYAVDQINSEVFYGIEPLFEFPFDNDSLEENLIEFGSIVNTREKVFWYDGDYEIGVTIRIHAIGEIRGLSIYNTDTREMMSIDDEKFKALIGSYIQAGDDIVITTSIGEKGISLTRAGVNYNILNALNRPIKWFQLRKGDNSFAYRAEEGISNVQFSMEYQTIYEGV